MASIMPEPSASQAQNASPSSTFPNRSPAVNELAAPSMASLDKGPPVVDAPPAPNTTIPAGNATEECLPASDMSPHSYDLLGGVDRVDGSLPRLSDAWNGVDPPTPVGTRAAGLGHPPAAPATSLKYPVLQPLMPFLESNLPRRLVFDLLELYFTSAFSTHMHPVCHHIHCYVLRKASFLSRDHPRPSSPSLLASMLWVAALDDRAFALSVSPLQRKKICQFLCALTIRLLGPLIHVSLKEQGIPGPTGYSAMSQEYPPGTVHHPFETGGDDRGLVGPAGSLDDVITYIHVASIISASEQKAASMRW